MTNPKMKQTEKYRNAYFENCQTPWEEMREYASCLRVGRRRPQGDRGAGGGVGGAVVFSEVHVPLLRWVGVETRGPGQLPQP